MAPRLATLFVFAALLSTPLAAAPSDKAPNLADSIGQQPFRQWLATTDLGRMVTRNRADLVEVPSQVGSRLKITSGFRNVLIVRRTAQGQPDVQCIDTEAGAEALLSNVTRTVEKQP